MSVGEIYSGYIHKSKYARWMPGDGRREDWLETVGRYIYYWHDKGCITWEEADVLLGYVHSQKSMPSMRAMMVAGLALDTDNVAGYNCSYTTAGGEAGGLEVLTKEMQGLGFDEPVTIALSDVHDFDEAMYILMCSTGVGFSVERQFITHLPVVGHKLPRSVYLPTEENYPGVPKHELSTFNREENTVYVADSKYGWASALRIVIVELYNGNFDIKWDTSAVRRAGTPLKTFGGRASGPEPLEDVFTFTVSLFKQALGRKLNSIECHDLMCKIADAIIVGGVRRAALISLSNLTDQRMANAKSGAWYEEEPQRRLANNSWAATEKPDVGIFMKEWQNLYASRSGERGIFNREASQKQAREIGRRNPDVPFGTNPCGEIVLRPHQFCNLSEVVCRAEDTFEDLKDKVRIATILGTLQATLTNFKYLRPIWRKNTEEEALLGVSLTGIMDHPVLNGSTGGGFDQVGNETLEDALQMLKQVALDTNAEWADRLGINRATATTCVKPSGTVSQLVDSASGIHPRYSPYYIRRAKSDIKDPLCQFMIDQGIPHEPDYAKPDQTMVFSFPIKAPEGAMTTSDLTAVEHMELWKIYRDHWCEHNPSVTITVKEHEWPEVGAWVWKNFDKIGGMSFMPEIDLSVYKQTPYEEIDEETYHKMVAELPSSVDWSGLAAYEKEDTTEAMAERACQGGSCEI